MPKALLVYPEFSPSYWSAKYALEFLGKKGSMPPLGLLTVAALFPKEYELRLIDLNIEALSDADLAWADYVFVSAMVVQKASVAEILKRCKAMKVKSIVGGPYATSYHAEINDADYLVLGEVEDNFGEFLSELESGVAVRIFPAPTAAPLMPTMAETPVPRFDLLKLEIYRSMAIQLSRGCPFDCEFCDITKLFGRVPRIKGASQVLSELQYLLDLGWRGSVFIVDDNFIGNQKAVRAMLPEIISWQQERGYPFSFYTEASVNLAQMPELMELMVQAGFNMVFLGIETPNPQALISVNKKQNVRADNPNYLLEVVQTIQRAGLEVSAGFILGLDADDQSSFDAQIDFIQKAGIPTAMVGLLNALKGTKLYDRLSKEGRLLEESSGNNVSLDLNFIPKLDSEVLIAGYRKVLRTIYDSTLSNYFARCYTFIRNWRPQSFALPQPQWPELRAFFLSIWRQVFSRQGPAYLKFMVKVLSTKPKLFPEAIRMAVMGYHFQRVTSQQLKIEDFKRSLLRELERIERLVSASAQLHGRRAAEMKVELYAMCERVRRRYRQIHTDYRLVVNEALLSFQLALEQKLAGISWRLELPLPELV